MNFEQQKENEKKKKKKMTNFKFSSSFFENIYSISKQEITNRICTIHINNKKEIQIPLLVAVSFSSLISQMLTTDLLMTDFYVEDPLLDDIQENTIDKLIELLNFKEIQLENEDITQIAKLGKVFGNNELLSLYYNLVKNYEQNINEDNAISLVQQKISFGIPIEELKQEVEYISNNFSQFINKLIELSQDIKYFNFIDCVVKNDNLRLHTEDELLLFIIKLCQQNRIYVLLFQYVLLEYCSVESISAFIDYINKYISKDNDQLNSIIKCMNRKLVQGQIPIKQNDQKRYNISIYEYDENDPLHGILRHEYLNDNVEMRASSEEHGEVYNLINKDKFYTKNEKNSWIEGSLKNKKPFVATKYIIKGNSCGNYHLKSWKLEGHRISDGKWIVLDVHLNEPFSDNELKTFSIQCQEKIDKILLTQTGENTHGNEYCLYISAFDIFGTIFL